MKKITLAAIVAVTFWVLTTSVVGAQEVPGPCVGLEELDLQICLAEHAVAAPVAPTAAPAAAPVDAPAAETGPAPVAPEVEEQPVEQPTPVGGFPVQVTVSKATKDTVTIEWSLPTGEEGYLSEWAATPTTVLMGPCKGLQDLAGTEKKPLVGGSKSNGSFKVGGLASGCQYWIGVSIQTGSSELPGGTYAITAKVAAKAAKGISLMPSWWVWVAVLVVAIIAFLYGMATAMTTPPPAATRPAPRPRVR